MSRRKKKIVKEPPVEVRTEDEEREFWAEHDVVDYFDWESTVEARSPR